MDAWLISAADRLAREAGQEPGSVALSADDSETLLELARLAAHESGDRRNAPLLCYLVGRLAGQGASVAELADTVRRSTS